MRAFAALGVREATRFESGSGLTVGLAAASGPPAFWVSPASGAETRQLHVALVAPDRAAVDAAHAAALEEGLEVLPPPREWPEYHAVFLRDPDGHDVESVHPAADPGINLGATPGALAGTDVRLS
ncbi:MAG TPA: VOC family protein [Thermoleophilia bacterium]|nr:VOC family protein [Thermoleophilia bacterium]